MVTVDVRDAFCLHPLPEGGAVAALRGLSLAVPKGELLVVHGPNGSGKSTLLRVLAGEQTLAAGRATVVGQDLTDGSGNLSRWRSRSLGQIDQNSRRLLRPEFDVLGNVALQLRIAGTPRAAARSRAREALDALNLGSLAPRSVGTLSGGQRQRVAVCAALAHRPELVLADEPTGELDLASAEAVYSLLAEATRAAGATLVMVTHDRRAGAIADRVVRIRDGRISETWTPGGRELLVMDDRGWVRLPRSVRDRVPERTLWSPSVSDVGVELRQIEDARADSAVGSPIRWSAEKGCSQGSSPDFAGGADSGSGSGSGDALIRLEGVRLRYPGAEQYVLGPEPVALEVRAGEMVVVAGRSGAGKSTLLRVVLGLQRPDEGTVALGGQDLTDLDRDQRAQLRGRTSAVVMQQVHLALTVHATGDIDLARAARGLPAAPELVAGLLDRLGLAGLAHRRVASLSGGERQRVALARALALQPKLLVLDEPTSQLDESSAQRVAGVLGEVAATGTAVLVASHDPALIESATRVPSLLP